MQDIFFNGIPAFQQVCLLITGGILLLIGGLLLGAEIQWRAKGLRVMGTVIGVRIKKSCYFPVYEYTLPTGETVQSTSSTGSSLARGKETGRIAPLRVMPDDPQRVEAADCWLTILFGFFFFIPGAVLAYLAFALYPLSIYTAVILGGFLFYAAAKGRKYIIPKEQRLKPEDWRAERRAARRREMEALPIANMEEVLHSPAAVAAREKQKKDARIAAPFMLIFAAALLFGAYDTYGKMSQLDKHGVRAEGQVVRFAEKNTGSSSEYPVVRFVAKDGNAVTFTGKVGASVPLYQLGEKVNVLYLEKNPQGTAAIKSSLGIWVAPILFLAAGIGFVLLFLRLRVF